jgi:glycosyl transferase family 87
MMAIVAAVWLTYQYWRLLWGDAAIWNRSPPGAVDLRIFQELVRGWVDGRDVYVRPRGLYPPASHLLLWPLIGWVDVNVARYLWAATSAAGLCWLAIVLTRSSLARSDRERALICLLILSCYASGATIGNGQLGIHVLVAVLAAVLILTRAHATWATDFFGAALMLFALVKPTMAAPFFWLVLIVPGRLRPAMLVVAAYAVVTWWALQYQTSDVETLVREWLRNASRESTIDGYADIFRWLSMVGLSQLSPLASLAIMAATGCWVYLNRRNDLWQLIGVVALVSRFGFHHRWYDDMLVVLAIVAAFRLRDDIQRRLGPSFELLLGAAVFSVLAPGGLYVLPAPLNQIYVASQIAIWLALLFVLIFATRRDAYPDHMESAGRLSIAAT